MRCPDVRGVDRTYLQDRGREGWQLLRALRLKCPVLVWGLEGGEQYFTCLPGNVKGAFPGGPVVKNPSANAGAAGPIPGLGRFHVPRGN